MSRFIIDNRFVRGIYYLYNMYFGLHRKKFAKFSNTAIISPPFSFSNPSNISIGPNVVIGSGCTIMATNAKCIIKGRSAIAKGLTIVTGNHARLVGLFVTDITENNKPAGYDHDVIIEEDVWIGSNVTILSGVRVGRGTTIAANAVVAKNTPPLFYNRGYPCESVKVLLDNRTNYSA